MNKQKPVDSTESNNNSQLSDNILPEIFDEIDLDEITGLDSEEIDDFMNWDDLNEAYNQVLEDSKKTSQINDNIQENLKNKAHEQLLIYWKILGNLADMHEVKKYTSYLYNHLNLREQQAPPHIKSSLNTLINIEQTENYQTFMQMLCFKVLSLHVISNHRSSKDSFRLDKNFQLNSIDDFFTDVLFQIKRNENEHNDRFVIREVNVTPIIKYSVNQVEVKRKKKYLTIIYDSLSKNIEFIFDSKRYANKLPINLKTMTSLKFTFANYLKSRIKTFEKHIENDEQLIFIQNLCMDSLDYLMENLHSNQVTENKLSFAIKEQYKHDDDLKNKGLINTPRHYLSIKWGSGQSIEKEMVMETITIPFKEHSLYKVTVSGHLSKESTIEDFFFVKQKFQAVLTVLKDFFMTIKEVKQIELFSLKEKWQQYMQEIRD